MQALEMNTVTLGTRIARKFPHLTSLFFPFFCIPKSIANRHSTNKRDPAKPDSITKEAYSVIQFGRAAIDIFGDGD